MSNLRFYSVENLSINLTVKLSDNTAAHATRALRLQLGDAIILFNGDGFDYGCELVLVKKNEVFAKVNTCTVLSNESSLNITLLQGISSGDRMDYTIQKAVELGVKQIQPIATERSLVKLNQERAEKRVVHWQNVVISACEQSGRAFVPQVHMPVSLSVWLAQNQQNSDCRLLLNPIGVMRLNQLPTTTQAIQILIGAEGGLTQHEIDAAMAHGFQSIILGPRVLRTETAALTAIACLQSLWGDF